MVLLLLPGGALAGTDPDLSGISYEQRPGAQLPHDASFMDEHGLAIPLREAVGGRPAVLTLGYFACPSLCGVARDDVAAALQQSGLRAAEDYTWIFLGIDDTERPADAARAKAENIARHPAAGAEAGWRFLTGARPQIERVAQAVGFHARFDAGLKQFLHPSGVVLVTPDGRVSGYLLGVGYPAADLRTALRRAGAGDVARRAANPVLLLCFHYDPVTGRYSLAVEQALRLGGGLTVIMIGGLLVVLIRRGQRKPTAANAGRAG